MFEKLPSISEKEWNTDSGVAKFQVEFFMCSSNQHAGTAMTIPTFSLIQLVKELLLVCTSSYIN